MCPFDDEDATEGREMAFIDRTIEVAADIRDVYALWTAFEEFPTFMTTIETVAIVPDDQLHWVAIVEDETFEWDADIVEHVPEEKIMWRAVDGRETGEVRFEKVDAGTTQITYQLEYDPSVWGDDSRKGRSWAEKSDDARKVRSWMEHRVTDDLATFKKLAEGLAAA
jgi:uncharacterized membrane protein